MDGPVERRLIAVLAADIVGYSRLMGVDEEGTHYCYKALRRELIDPNVAAHCGRIVKSTGDGFLAEFPIVVEAVVCAVELQRALAERNAKELPARRMDFRIGINLGDVIIESDDIYGDGVNIAARLEGVAEPGGICISDAVRVAAGNKVPVDYESMGDQSLKNIVEPIRVYRVRSRPGVPMPHPSAAPRSVGPMMTGLHQQISVSRMPVTGRLLLGREEELRQLEQAWATPHCNIVSLVAWGGVGKSTLINHWVRRMAQDGYRGADRVYAWSFYHQGTIDRVTAADEFIEASLTWFGDTDPNKGSAREKGERLAKHVQQRRALLILDGLEPLQRPPGPKEGTLKDDGLHALVCELASFNPGVCVITTRLPVTDLQDFQHAHRQINLSCLTSRDGAKLLRAHHIEGSEHDLEQASEEFGGHCLALTLLSNYLNDAYQGNVTCRRHVDALQDDIRQGDHAKRVLNSYIGWIDDVAELEVLRVMGLFDRPAGAGAVQALRASAIPELTKEINRLSDENFNRVISRLRRAGLLTERDVHSPDTLDAHPLVRQFFREQLQSDFVQAWHLGNECLFRHFQGEAKAHPENLAEMDVLFQAVVFGCNAGLHGQAFRDVYLPRIIRHQQYYAANVLGARGTLLSVLSHFFEDKSWERLIQPGPEKEGLEPREQLTVLQHVRTLLTATAGYNTLGAIHCYQTMKSLCERLGDARSFLFGSHERLDARARERAVETRFVPG